MSLLSSSYSSHLPIAPLRGADSESTSSTELGTFPSLLSDLESETGTSTRVGFKSDSNLNSEEYKTPLSISRSSSVSSYTTATSDESIAPLLIPNRVEYPNSEVSSEDFQSIPGSFPSSITSSSSSTDSSLYETEIPTEEWEHVLPEIENVDPILDILQYLFS